MNKNPQQKFYPISMLPTFVGQVDQLIETLEEKHKLFIEAQANPASLDDDIIDRALRIFQKNTEHIGCYYEQLIKWRKEALSDNHNKSLDVFAQKIAQARNLNTKLINLTNEIKETTINKILEKDDAELALDFLSKNLKTNE